MFAFPFKVEDAFRNGSASTSQAKYQSHFTQHTAPALAPALAPAPAPSPASPKWTLASQVIVLAPKHIRFGGEKKTKKSPLLERYSGIESGTLFWLSFKQLCVWGGPKSGPPGGPVCGPFFRNTNTQKKARKRGKYREAFYDLTPLPVFPKLPNSRNSELGNRIDSRSSELGYRIDSGIPKIPWARPRPRPRATLFVWQDLP